MWRIGIAFLLGQCCLHALTALPSIWPYAILLFAGCSAALVLRTPVIVALLLGFGWAWHAAETRLGEDLPIELEGVDLVVVGDIATIPDVQEVDAQFELALIDASHAKVPSRLRLAWYESGVLPQPGERWRLVVRLKRRNGFANPGGFDYEGHLFRTGIGATGYVRSDDRNRRLSAAAWRPYPVLRARAFIAERIRRAVGDSPMLGILQGLAVGDTHAMSAEQWRIFGITGTAHLMAISGLHISMLATFAAFLGRRIVALRSAQRRGLTSMHGEAVAGIAAAVLYSLLAGMSVPTQRTLVMLCIFFVARWARREIAIGNALGLSLLGVLVVDPFATQSVGAWLSFGAVAIILLAVHGRVRPARGLSAFARVQWAITLGLLPLLVISFGNVSIVAPFANALAVPIFSFVVVPLTLLGAAFASLWIDLGGFFLAAASRVLTLIWPILERLAEWPFAQWYLPQMTALHYASLTLGMVMLVLPAFVPMRAAAVFLCVPPLLFSPQTPSRGGFELTVLDVGQGLSVVVRTRRHSLVYDAGPAFRTGRDTGELVVVPYLRSQGIHRIDQLLISHGDLDHQGGMTSILRAMATASVLVGASVNAHDVQSEHCALGRSWTWDGVTFEIVHAGEGAAASDNDTSCVVRIAGAGGSVLLTGDIESAAEEQLVARGIGPVSVVLVAHHGSRTSSSEAFVRATRPQVAVVSAGYRNRWGFPKGDVVERWRASGARIFSTVESGAVQISMNPQQPPRVRQHRHEHRRYWSSR